MTEDLTFADTRKSSYSFSSSCVFSLVSPDDVCVDRKYSPLSCNQSMACVESTFKKMQKPFHVFIYKLIFDIFSIFSSAQITDKLVHYKRLLGWKKEVYLIVLNVQF